jgi:hypothetical protein
VVQSCYVAKVCGYCGLRTCLDSPSITRALCPSKSYRDAATAKRGLAALSP